MKKLRILIADDHALIRRGARELLQGHLGWRVVGEAKNGIELVEKAKKLKPDVAIVDISMPKLDGVQATRQIRATVPNTKVLVLTLDESDEMVKNALEAGAQGYILKSDLADGLLKAVKEVAGGQRSLAPKVSDIVLSGFLTARGEHRQEGREVRTTPRELEVMRLLAAGKANKEVAAQLGITVRTVETYRARIMRKLGLHSAADLIYYTLRQQIETTPGQPRAT